jgi:hypothetical protein
MPVTADFSAAFVVVALLSSLTALAMLRLPATAGEEISGRTTPRSQVSDAPGTAV